MLRRSLACGTLAARRAVPPAGTVVRAAPRRLKSTVAAPAAQAAQMLPAELWVAPASRRAVGAWVLGCSGMVFSMVVVGGVTRLTKSGLSMTEWRPQGHRPPANAAQWEEEFGRYRRSPEFQMHPDMSVDEFKKIFWPEYLHRMLGRTIGVAFAVPALYFVARRRIRMRWGTGELPPRLAALFLAGGCQGLVGWWMVRSGLEAPAADAVDDVVRVSPYRLAMHLTTGFAIYAGLVWTGLTIVTPVPAAAALEPGSAALAAVAKVRRLARPLAVLIGVTACSGAFVAGVHAGHHYNTFPLMDGRVVPAGYWLSELGYRNFFENIPAVQFDHRLLATATVAATLFTWNMARKLPLPRSASAPISALLVVVGGQFVLGITTLIHAVPVSLGAAHQAGALTLFTVALATLHGLRMPAAGAATVARVVRATSARSSAAARPALKPAVAQSEER